MPTRVAKATDSFNSHWEAHVMTKENNITLWVLIGYYRKHSFTNTQQNTWCLHLSFKRIISWLFFSPPPPPPPPPFKRKRKKEYKIQEKKKDWNLNKAEWSSDDLHTKNFSALFGVTMCACVSLCVRVHVCTCMHMRMSELDSSSHEWQCVLYTLLPFAQHSHSWEVDPTCWLLLLQK